MVKTELSSLSTHSPSSSSAAAAATVAAAIKRKKPEELELNGAKKKPRTRVSYSCGECHRRKQKCDRQIPCSHCIARKVPELCKAYTPGKSDQDIHARLSRLERIIDEALPHYAGISHPGSPAAANGPAQNRVAESGSMTPEDDEQSQGDEGDAGMGTFDSGKWYGNSVSGSVAPATMLEQLQQFGPSPDPNRHNSMHSYMSYNNGVPVPDHSSVAGDPEVETPILQNAEPSAAELLQMLIRDCGLSENKLHELMKELPSRQLTDVLIDHYFKTMNWTRYPISEDDFRASYAALYKDGVGSDPGDIRFLPLLFVVLAISVRLSPEHIGGDSKERKLKSMRFYWSSRRALLIAAAIQPDSLEMVLTRLLSARYLTFDRRITECWSQLGAAVCTAQALGLHRDPGAMRLEPAQVEYRRRIWAYLYHADRSYALVLGRPYAIQDEYSTTHPPHNIEELTSLTPAALAAPPPLSKPTRMTFVILRHGLAYIIGKMVHYFQRVRVQNHYSEVLALDDELQRFIDTLPAHFSFDPDTSLDATEEYIPLHRYLLTTEILFVRISLHRPYILRRLDSDRYARSRRACFSAALMDFEVRQAYRRTQPKEILRAVTNAYREFQTAMISGIYLILDPVGKDAKAMHDILDCFIKDHENVDDMDVTTRREMKIIEFLKNKATQAEIRGVTNGRKMSVDASSATTEHSMDAQANLLLSLQQSRNASLMQHQRSASEGSNGVLRPQYGPLPNALSGTSSTGTPTSMVGSMAPPHSPSFQRIQGETSTSTRHSPAGSGSPGADEDMAAQNMLDHWCNVVTNPPPLLLDSYTTNNSLSSGQWGTYAPSVGDISNWMTTPYFLNGDPTIANGLEGADYSIWEHLVNTLRGGPLQ